MDVCDVGVRECKCVYVFENGMYLLSCGGGAQRDERTKC